MSYQASGAVGIRFEDTNEVIWAVPRPEDQDRLAELLQSGRTLVQLATPADDLEGHAQSPDVTLDVEGHALTLRLPSATDAAELRRRLAIGAAAATLVVVGGAAALQGINSPGAQTQVAPAPGPAIVQPGYQNPASDVGIMDQAAQQAAQQFSGPAAQPGYQNPASDVGIMDQAAQQAAQQQAASTTQEAAPGTQPHRTVNDPYNIDIGPGATTQTQSQSQSQSGYQDVASDVGIMDQPASQAAEQAAGDEEENTGIPRPGQPPEPR